MTERPSRIIAWGVLGAVLLIAAVVWAVTGEWPR